MSISGAEIVYSCHVWLLQEKYDTKYNFCISKDGILAVQNELTEKFAQNQTLPGTPSLHFFSEISDHEISFKKKMAEDESFNGTFLISGGSKVAQDDIISDLSDYIAYLYGGKWWIGVVMNQS